MITPELVALGAVAGLTIFLGLPVAAMKRVTPRTKGFLNAITIGVLVFILIEVLPAAELNVQIAMARGVSGGVSYVAALLAGLAIGMFGLVIYEARFIRIRQRRSIGSSGETQLPKVTSGKRDDGSSQGLRAEEKTLGIGEAEARGPTSPLVAGKAATVDGDVSLSSDDAKRIALSIAMGIGVHNFSEGLAIGQSFASAAVGLSVFLAIGFALHNTTEGFGIAAPMAGYAVPLSYLVALGFIGGLPTLIGTIVGGAYPASPLALTFFLSLAAGALIYILSGMFYVARRQTSNGLFMLGIFAGFLIAYGADLFLTALGA